MKPRLMLSLLVAGAGLALMSVGSRAQEVRDFTSKEPTPQELLDTLKPRSHARGIKAAAATPLPPLDKLQCAYYRKKASRGIKLVPESNTAALKITFAYNSTELTKDSVKTLDVLGDVLKSNELEACCFQVQGHTDSKGSDSYNKKLSERRARSVVSYLAKRSGIDQDRLLVTGYGAGQPIADNQTEDGRQKNRRVQVVNLGYGQAAEQ